MSAEVVKINIETARDILTVIMEDVEENLYGSSDGLLRKRGELVISQLHGLDAYLNMISQEVA